MKIFGIGNALVDIMTSLDKDDFLSTNNLPKGSMQLVDSNKSQELLEASSNFNKQQVSGGSAANTIRSLAKLGVNVAFLGKVGEDELGNFYETEMNELGVITDIKRTKTPTGTALALVSPDGELTFATHLGAAVTLSPEDMNEEKIGKYDILYLEGYLVMNHALFERAAKIKIDHNLNLAIDLASFNVVEAERDFLLTYVNNYVDIVFANEEEAASFFPGKTPEESVVAFSKMVDTAIVKIGAEGAYIRKGNDQVLVPGRIANCIDTTGAGDNFAAGYLFGLTQGLDSYKSGQLANLLGSNVIEIIGTTMDEKRWSIINQEIKEIVG